MALAAPLPRVAAGHRPPAFGPSSAATPTRRLCPSASASLRPFRALSIRPGTPSGRSRSLGPARASTDSKQFPNAKTAIEESDAAFKDGRTEEALRGFMAAIEMRPNADEARAAYYNAACCLTKLGRFSEAADYVKVAVNEYDLRFAVALKDPDLLRLREQPVFDEVVSEVKGGFSQRQFIKARQEAKSPFMLFRTIALGGLSAGAGLGLIIILGRLAASVRGGEGAPDLRETLQNAAINSGILFLLVFLLIRDRQKEQRELSIIEREEMLGKLLVQDANSNKTAMLQTLRGIARPIIIAGTRNQVQKAMKSAEPYRSAIKDRGIELVPLVLSMDDPADKISALKAELAAEETRPKAQGFSKAPRKEEPEGEEPPKGGRVGVNKYNVQVGKKKLLPVRTEDWEAWLETARKAAGVKDTNVYVQVQLDGSVRGSGVGIPPWEQLMKDIPELEDIRSKLMQ